MDSTGLKLCGAGKWLIEKHSSKTCRSRRKLHIGLDADTGQIVAAVLTAKEVDAADEVGPLLDQIAGPVASLTGDGAYDQEGVCTAGAERFPGAAMIVPPRSTAVPSDTAETAPTQRDRLGALTGPWVSTASPWVRGMMILLVQLGSSSRGAAWQGP